MKYNYSVVFIECMLLSVPISILLHYTMGVEPSVLSTIRPGIIVFLAIVLYDFLSKSR